jgi:phytoene synthase
MSAHTDLAACRAALRGGSRTFHAASFLLPRAVREPASALYAFCRAADDAVDSGDAVPALAQLRGRLQRIYEGRPAERAADRAFAAVVGRYAIPRALPEALLEGFEWDAAGRRYEDLADLQSYAARVAGSVGAMMALLMEARSKEAVARACDLGVAMQFSNIARDVGEDARAGRLYLPLRWMREAGIDAQAWLVRPEFSTALGQVVERVVRAADLLYERAQSGVSQLPPACRPGIRAAALLYAGIGREVALAGGDSVSRRAVVPASRKAWLIAQALAPAAPAAPEAPPPALEQTQYLVDAVAAAPAPPAGGRGPGAQAYSQWNIAHRLVRVIELFERLERRELQREETA